MAHEILSSLDREHLIKLASSLPRGSPERKSILAGLTQLGSINKVSHRPVLPEITLEKYRKGEAMMMYFIDEESNHSKFYEMAIIQEPSGFYTLKKRWGALTDQGAGRVDSKDEMGLSYSEAVRAMTAHGNSKLRKGYRDAFKNRPLGQYPVGLSRSVGFGWGTQSITKCVPALRDLNFKILEALHDVEADNPGELLLDLYAAQTLLERLPNSSMAREIQKFLRPPLNRLERNPKFLQDPMKTSQELKTLVRYLQRQMADCNV